MNQLCRWMFILTAAMILAGTCCMAVPRAALKVDALPTPTIKPTWATEKQIDDNEGCVADECCAH